MGKATGGGMVEKADVGGAIGKEVVSGGAEERFC
jgi:hypothetical protein